MFKAVVKGWHMPHVVWVVDVRLSTTCQDHNTTSIHLPNAVDGVIRILVLEREVDRRALNLQSIKNEVRDIPSFS